MMKQAPGNHAPLTLPFSQGWASFLERKGRCPETYERFSAIILHHYQHRRRQFDWRHEITPYRVLVSEIMLQQTQTSRVAPKFALFMERFPDFRTLAEATFRQVLQIWKGLGYNRRAKYLHEIAGLVVKRYHGLLPADPSVLASFPGIGPATAASICVFTWNRPLAFIETNIRTVFIHFFFADCGAVRDREILVLVEKTMDREQPRRWYYALMDYGVMLKKTVGNLNRRSTDYRRQSRFQGSDRQLRGLILTLLLDHFEVAEEAVATLLRQDDKRVTRVIADLVAEGIILRRQGVLQLD